MPLSHRARDHRARPIDEDGARPKSLAQPQLVGGGENLVGHIGARPGVRQGDGFQRSYGRPKVSHRRHGQRRPALGRPHAQRAHRQLEVLGRRFQPIRLRLRQHGGHHDARVEGEARRQMLARRRWCGEGQRQPQPMGGLELRRQRLDGGAKAPRAQDVELIGHAPAPSPQMALCRMAPSILQHELARGLLRGGLVSPIP